MTLTARPASCAPPRGDTNGAVHGFASLGFALYYREKTGQGQYLDISMTDALFHFHEGQLMAHHLTGGEFQPKRYGAHHVAGFPAGSFRGPEGYIVVLALDLQWANVCRCICRMDPLDNPRYATMAQRAEYRDELIPLIEGWMAGFPRDQDVLDELERHHVPAGPVLSPLDALDHPYFKEPRHGPLG